MTAAPIIRLGLQLTGYSFPGVPDSRVFDHVVAIAKTAERAGFDSLWAMDHVHQIATVGARDDPILESYTTMAALAPVTSSLRLGTLVSAGGFRNPALLAKMVTTLDVISGGRAMLGIGAGWLEEEYRAYGVPFPPMRVRLERLDEAVRICRAMFVAYAPTFAGRHHRIDGALNVPPPLTPGGPPILIGGSGERVLIPIVARHGDASNFYGGPATLRHKIGVLERACEEIQRDPGEITKTWLGAAIVADSERELQPLLELAGARLSVPPSAVRSFNLCGVPGAVAEQVRAYREAGADGLIVTMYEMHDLDRVAATGQLLREAMDA